LEEDFIVEKILNPETRDYGFNLLTKEYSQRVYWHVRKMVIDHDDADDLVQDIFIKIWKNLDKFRKESKLFTWIYRIATNETLNFLERKKKRFFLPLHDVASELQGKLDAGILIDGDEVQYRLQSALLKLPEKQRIVFNMKYFDQMKFDEISEITGTSVGALKASYHHAVKKIEENLTED